MLPQPNLSWNLNLGWSLAELGNNLSQTKVDSSSAQACFWICSNFCDIFFVLFWRLPWSGKFGRLSLLGSVLVLRQNVSLGFGTLSHLCQQCQREQMSQKIILELIKSIFENMKHDINSCWANPCYSHISAKIDLLLITDHWQVCH